ncbi:hypothetical protein KSD_94090 [Ktedonobacter sp. SOSP1-85]|nr:hypothetical protein KSD_94090 [Ktedonobacter sp. SOSP1-85]
MMRVGRQLRYHRQRIECTREQTHLDLTGRQFLQADDRRKKREGNAQKRRQPVGTINACRFIECLRNTTIQPGKEDQGRISRS